MVVLTYEGGEWRELAAQLEELVARQAPAPLSRHPGWLRVLADGLGHKPYCLIAVQDGEACGFLPLAHVSSVLFGSFLVSLPYLNYGGVVGDDEQVARSLIDRAVELADQLDVRYLELRDDRPIAHPRLGDPSTEKVHMRLELPATAGALWDDLSSKVRNQVRKGTRSNLTVHWGAAELLDDFYGVFSRNMRDLGTPVYGRELFSRVLHEFATQSELCVVRAGSQAVAAALLLHGWGITEVPSASSLREFNSTNANMLMYWNLLERAVGRGQRYFDFGRSSRDSNTYRFKEQWGAVPHAAVWQSYGRSGSPSEMRPNHPRYQRRIRLWQRLPVSLTRLIGPAIVRGIP